MMKKTMTLIGSEKMGYDSEFSIFMRTVSDEEKERVFLEAARLATQDQQNMMKASENQ